MKYYPRLGLYKASNLMLDPAAVEAWSYGWWQFLVRLPDGTVVWNGHSYSPSTRKQQGKAAAVLGQLGIRVDIVVDFRPGLQVYSILPRLIEHYEGMIDKTRAAAAKPRIRQTTKDRLASEISALEETRWQLIGIKARQEGEIYHG